MKREFQQLMNEATRLTRSGALKAAMAAIQAALGRGNAAAPAAARAAAIDVEARDVPEAREVIEVADVPEKPEVTEITVTDTPEAVAAARPDAEQAIERAKSVPASPGRFVGGSYSGAQGGRDYKLYVPPGAGERPLPLVVMLHGCTQTPDDFAAGTAMNEAAEARGFYVLYPAQSQQANPQRCWNWFKHNHQQRGRGEPALLAGMTRQVMEQHAVDPDRIYAAGLSAGGAMAAILGDTYPELYAAVGVHSGLAAGAATDLPSALAAMQGNGGRTAPSARHVPTIVFHGDADSTVHPRNGEQVTAASSAGSQQPDVQQQQPAGKHRSTRTVHRDAVGKVLAEHWLVHGAAHAWSGGSARGSYTDASGPDASAEMLRFFLEHPRRAAQ